MINFGIDLGTTNSAIAKFDQGKVLLFKNPVGQKDTLPSVVALRNGRLLVGEKAREFLRREPHHVAAGFKRKMGTDETFRLADETKTPVELSALVLRELKTFIHSGETPQAAVITIPASFDTIQSNATKEAGQLAGFEEVLLLQEPIAASLAYANQDERSDFDDGQWLVYDLGGGTFDVALVRIQRGEMKVVDHEGDNFLGGHDLDRAIVEDLIVPYLESQGTFADLIGQMKSASGQYNALYQKLLLLAEEAKIQLTANDSAEVEFETTDDRGDTIEAYLTIPRAQFENLVEPILARTTRLMVRMVQRNQLKPSDLRFVLMVGGSTYIPYLRAQVAERLGIAVNTEVDPTTAVAVGAAYYAGSRARRQGAEGTERAEKTERAERAEGAETTERAEKAEKAEGAEKTEKTEKAEGTETAERAEGAETTERAEKAEGAEKTEKTEKAEKAEGAETAEGAGKTEGATRLRVKVAYQRATQEKEEYFTARFEGDRTGLSYRITRADGGYDSGEQPLTEQIKTFLPLIPGAYNEFALRVYDPQGNPVPTDAPPIGITQGRFSVVGQPLPLDICLEVDDVENNTTVLEVVFEKNEVLPLKKTLTKQITRTIAKSSDDRLTINVVEGPRTALPAANQPIGYISIEGKALTRDLIRGSDVEITLEISESRDLTINAYLMMTDQEYEHVFQPSKRAVNVSRLAEELQALAEKMRREISEAEDQGNYEQAQQLVDMEFEILELADQARKMSADDSTDARFQLEDRKRQLAREVDDMTRDKFIIRVKNEYFEAKRNLEFTLESYEADEEAQQQYDDLMAQEKGVLATNSSLKIRDLIDQLNRLGWRIRWQSSRYIRELFTALIYGRFGPFTDTDRANDLIINGQAALEDGNDDQLRVIINQLFELLPPARKQQVKYGGTGIG